MEGVRIRTLVVGLRCRRWNRDEGLGDPGNIAGSRALYLGMSCRDVMSLFSRVSGFCF